MISRTIFAALIAALACVPLFSAEVKTAKPAAAANWWDSGVAYQIFVRSYLDTDGDGKGDLKGVTAKLDYLTNLGVTALYLNPIFQSTSYHGYDTVDYYSINKDLGTMADFEELVKEAHTRGLKIILDMVFNHTSVKHPWFVDSATNANSPYADWYLWSTNDRASEGWVNLVNSKMPAWNAWTDIKDALRYSNFYYAAFNMTIPDLNLKNPEVVKEIKKITKFWLDKGVDGLRMDAAIYMVEDGPGKLQINSPSNFAFWKDYCSYVYSLKPDAYIIGEVFQGQDVVANYWQGDQGFRACFNFNYEGKASMALHIGGASRGMDKLKEKLAQYWSLTTNGMPVTFESVFISSHDRGRYAEAAQKPEMEKLGAVVQFTIPGGMPYVYYGDEIGQREGEKKIGDAEMRNPMWWNGSVSNAGFTSKPKPWVLSMAKDLKVSTNGVNVEAELRDPQSVLALYQKIIALRKATPALQKGDYEIIGLDISKDAGLASCLAFARKSGKSLAVVAVNAARTNVTFDQPITAPSVKAAAGKLKVVSSLWSKDLTAAAPKDVTDAVAAGNLKFELGPKDFLIVTME
jgi:glycosidase